MTIKEIYDEIICKPELHSTPKLYDNFLVWHLYKDAFVQAFCVDGDTSIDIISDSMWTGSLMHWHPDGDDMIDELYTLGKKGNILVLKKSLLGTSTFYAGPSENCPLAGRAQLYFGWRKWDGGRFIYLEQK